MEVVWPYGLTGSIKKLNEKLATTDTGAPFKKVEMLRKERLTFCRLSRQTMTEQTSKKSPMLPYLR